MAGATEVPRRRTPQHSRARQLWPEWHNAVVELANGRINVAQRRVFEADGFELVHRYGRPYLYRQRDVDLVWDGLTDDSKIAFERMHPFGLRIIATGDVSFTDLPMDKIRRLAFKYSLLIFRGFERTSKPVYTEKVRELGPIQSWVFGEVLEVKDNPEMDMNNVLTREAMPMHFDGTFKTKRSEDGRLMPDPPTFQIFECIQAPGGADGGRTLFTNTHMLLQQGVNHALLEKMKLLDWSVFTPQNKNFGGEPLKIPLVHRHEATGHDVLRWHEDWPQRITTFKPTSVRINGVDAVESDRISELLTKLLYDRRFVYEHTWTTGDYLIADNIELMHTRTAFSPCTRELWRIHAN
ncbi:Clavaminate synthase-like protein [Exidia glandulosa HHB12029]|uniref:Clavaminate synthase-like protein n=1 Tax=Exidia glandulosa HHB12029 TaxID=1314781 RepID=A0A165CVP1_EXIGL|nr:Clavaminate synthase-like protein [Exidia glandulosa HHB12029]